MCWAAHLPQRHLFVEWARVAPSPAPLCVVAQAPPCLAAAPLAEAFVEWSPRGSYLATVHRQGVALWGGKSFARLQRVG